MSRDLVLTEVRSLLDKFCDQTGIFGSLLLWTFFGGWGGRGGKEEKVKVENQGEGCDGTAKTHILQVHI